MSEELKKPTTHVPTSQTEPRRRRATIKKQPEPSQYETAMQIADKLGEKDEAARKYIQYVVWVLGRTQSRRLLHTTEEVQTKGGMMVEDDEKERWRTPREIFFHLAETTGKPKPGKVLYPFGSPFEVAQMIAKRLSEPEMTQMQQIIHIVGVLGEEQAQGLMQEAIGIDAGEGMMTPDGSRRRTVGGVFFYLVYNRGIPEEGKKLKKPYYKSPQAAKPPQPQPEAIPVFTWEDRIAAVREAEVERGTANVKITVVGRPGKIIDKGTCIVTAMQSEKFPPLPKGLPIPTATLTKYVVYIATKQWKKVADAIADPEDVLVVEGVPKIDPEAQAIAVFATNVTTKKMQMALKAKQQEQAQN